MPTILSVLLGQNVIGNVYFVFSHVISANSLTSVLKVESRRYKWLEVTYRQKLSGKSEISVVQDHYK